MPSFLLSWTVRNERSFWSCRVSTRHDASTPPAAPPPLEQAAMFRLKPRPQGVDWHCCIRLRRRQHAHRQLTSIQAASQQGMAAAPRPCLRLAPFHPARFPHQSNRGNHHEKIHVSSFSRRSCCDAQHPSHFGAPRVLSGFVRKHRPERLRVVLAYQRLDA